MLHEQPVTSLAFSPDSRYLATASQDHTARVWSATTGQEVTRMVHDHGVSAVAFSPDGSSVITATLDGMARVWEVRNRLETVRLVNGPAPLQCRTRASRISRSPRMAARSSRPGRMG